MIIGIDFDNTIADYTGVFHRVGVILGWLPKEVGQTKEDVKAYFINAGNEPKWTELQGIVYGKEINQAKPYLGCLEAIKSLKKEGHSIFIVSHKTKYPIIGDKTNFHIAATNWLKSHGFTNCTDGPIASENISFHEKQEIKINRISTLQCDFFIDDLSSVLNSALFPLPTEKILFNQKPHPSIELNTSDWKKVHPMINSFINRRS
ncbi:HAD family hydrolase [Pseudoalteromonas sp. Ld20]|uniref:HAD family hydrolase n=1 Tax=Pseudoalteromonas sp. Ld20 TaxID=649165 RepID=UPI0038703669